MATNPLVLILRRQLSPGYVSHVQCEKCEKWSFKEAKFCQWCGNYLKNSACNRKRL